MKTFIIGIICFTISGFATGQAKKSLSVSVEIVKDGDLFNSEFCKENCYLTRFEIINNEDTTLPISIWTCNWHFNWKSNNDSISIVGWGCDRNYPEITKLPPKKSFIFYASIYVRPGTVNKYFKMGFANVFPKFEDINSLDYDRDPKGQFFWSDLLHIDNFYDHFFYPIMK